MLSLKTRNRWTVAGCIVLIFAVLIVASLFVPMYGEICTTSEHTGHEECARHHVTLIAFIHFGKALDAAGVVITALATAAIAGFTYVLYRATKRQAELTQASIDLGNREFISTHRPKLRVRNVIVRQIRVGVPFHVQYQISNIGNTNATLIFAEARIEVPAPSQSMFQDEDAPPPGQHLDARAWQGSSLIPPGGRVIRGFDMNLAYSPRYAREEIVIRGEVRYRDGSGIERVTMFERFNPDGGTRFRRGHAEDPDAEYED